MLMDFYTKISFFEWLDKEDIKSARAQDPANCANAENRRNGENFHLAAADYSKYEKCSNHFDSYIVVYQMRNREKAHDNPVASSYSTRLRMVTSLFVVYIHQCIENSELIDNGYEQELLSRRIDYVKYANDLTDAIDGFNNSFLQLTWFDKNNEPFSYEFDSCVKFIGEAGMGKTTQMKKMYYF